MIVNTIKKHADKVAHFGAGMAVGLTAIFFPLYFAFLLVFLVGALKEVRDYFGYGDSDLYDAGATWLGGLFVITLILV